MRKMTETKKLSEYYSDIFKVYLNYSPEYRRNLVDLNDMFKWMKEIDLKIGISNKYEFFILMEWFSAFNLIKPFCIIRYPPKTFEGAQFSIRIGPENFSELYEKGYVVFPEEIYDIKISNEEDIRNIKQWQYKKTPASQDVQENLRNYIQFDLIKYFYHPIQFFQVLTYLRGYSYRQFGKKSQFLEFYWRRRFQFDDYEIERIKNSLQEEKKLVEDFIQEQISNGYGFNQFDFMFFRGNQWLIPRSILLWLKVETLYGPPFFRPSNSHHISLDFQIPIGERLKEKRFEAYLERHNDWIKKVSIKLTDYFEKDDFYFIQKFRQQTENYLRLDGLEHFIDLFLIIRSEKKKKLKGYLSYFVNILQVVKTLRRFEGLLIEKIPDLEKEKKESKWYEPKYYFESEPERIEYLQKVYLEYGLTQQDTYVVFVEGKSEKILLEVWLQLIYSRIRVKIDIQKLPGGRSSAKLFKFMIKIFSANEYFLILDADKGNYAQGKIGEYSDAGINEDSYHIFFPDFITANFNPNEIFKTFLDYFEEISEKIKTKTGRNFTLKESDKAELLNILESKDVGDKYEDLVEKYLKIKLENDNLKLKKPLFAKKLKDNIIFRGKYRRKYPFEDILGKFAMKIQMKTFPEELKMKINRD